MTGPRTRTIADDLRRRIANNELVPGALMPSEHELSNRYSVARGTARSALQLLEGEGLIEVLERRGRVVIRKPLTGGGQEPVKDPDG